MVESGTVCPSCGHANAPGQKFCGECGTSLMVACPSCGAKNPLGQKFCGECGASMPVACPSCRFVNPGGQKFCGECGTALGAPATTVAAPPSVVLVPAPAPPPSAEPPPLQEERRLITAIFCDLEGFTPLTESLDPEEVREIQTEYFAAMNAELHRFGGSVEKYAGDAVLALFGAPIAHEDDAERAVRCALSMQQAFRPVAEMAKREWGAGLAIRIGVNTGEAISGAWDIEGKRDYSATGDVVNTAARLQTACIPGGVIVGPETMHLARRAVRFGPREDLTLKGKSEPFPAYRVLGLRERIAERWETSEQLTPLVGREREVAQLMDAFERAACGEGRIVTVTAEAGVGKSRLLAEAVTAMSRAGTVVVRGRCLSFGQGMSLHLVADLLRTVCQLREGDDPTTIRDHIDTTVDSLLAPQDPDTRDAARDVLGTLFGLPPSPSPVSNADPQVRRQTLIRSLELLLSALSSHRPAILLLEDLHWVDEASAEVVAEVLPVIRDRKALVLATHRPGWIAPWSDSALNEPLVLQPLDEGDAVGMARSILGGVELDSELEQQVTDRAGGNPFFVEELLRSLQETGALVERDGRVGLAPGAAERLPSTLTELLLARLDQLDRSARTTAQHGSVIGRSFAVPVLAGISDEIVSRLSDALQALEQAQIALPAQQREEFVFRHATVREVAYNALLVRRRQALHAACARAIMALYPPEEHVDVIAYHFSRSRDHAEAAEWLERAADRAAGVFANSAAIEQYEGARERLEKIGAGPVDLARVDEKLGGILKIVSRYDEALEVLDRAAAGYRASGDGEGERRAVAQIGRVHRARSTPADGIARIKELLAQQEGAEPTSGLAALHVALARLTFTLGDYKEVVRLDEIAADIAAAVGNRRLLAEAEMSSSIALFMLGQTEQALAVMQATAPIAEEVGDFEVLNILVGNISLIYRDMGEFELSREYRERSAEVTERMGDMASHSFALASLGELMFFLGDWAHAERYLDHAMEIKRSLPTSWFSFLPPTLLGQLYAARGDVDAAITYLEGALASAQQGTYRHAERRIVDSLAEMDLMMGRPEAALARFEGVVDLETLDEEDSSLTATLPIAAWARLLLGDVERAEALACQAIERAVNEKAIVELLTAQRVAGMVSAARGRAGEAMQRFGQAVDGARQTRYPYALARALYEQGRAMGGQDQARALFEEALTIFERLDAALYASQCRAALGVVSVATGGTD